MSQSLDTFTRNYIVCALWSSTLDDDEPMDSSFDIEDLAPETLEKIRADCAKFQEDNATLLADLNLAQAGHDFWLTRNRHGAGFWDGDYPELLGEALTEASHRFPETDLYVGDDGRLYI